jgi:excisionase family DNA binding protein
MTDQPDYLTMGEAAALLGIDRRQIRRLVLRLGIEQIENPIDARQRLIRRSDVEQLRPFAAKKAAA